MMSLSGTLPKESRTKTGQSLTTRWGSMLAVTFGLLMTAFDASSLNLALPAIQQHLGLRFSQVQWILLAYIDCGQSHAYLRPIS